MRHLAHITVARDARAIVVHARHTEKSRPIRALFGAREGGGTGSGHPGASDHACVFLFDDFDNK